MTRSWKVVFDVSETRRVVGAEVWCLGGELDVGRLVSPLSLSSHLDVFVRQRYVTQELVSFTRIGDVDDSRRRFRRDAMTLTMTLTTV